METTEATPQSEEKDGCDFLLDLFLNMMELDEKNSMSVTLLVGGALVTGQAISSNAFFQEFAAKLPRSEKDPVVEGIARWLEKRTPPEPMTLEKLRDTLVDTRLAFIHLRGARRFPGGGFDDGRLMRIKVTEIQGWSLGG